MATAIDLGRREADQTRSELTLSRLGRAWKLQARGDVFLGALVDFLRGLQSKNTLRSYTFSLLQFWERFDDERNVFPTPDHVRRADAVAYQKYLLSRDATLTSYRLDHDPSRGLDRAIYGLVAEHPGIDLEAISGRLYSHIAIDQLAERLACLVKHRTLRRTPSIEEIRRAAGSLVMEIDPRVFRYFVPTVETPEGVDRAGMAAVRLSALASFWSYLCRAGENLPGRSEPLLRINVWQEPLKQVRRLVPSQQKVYRQKKKTTLELFLALLGTTFFRTHGKDGARAAALASFWGRPVQYGSTEPSYRDLRDRLLLLFMAQAGARSIEVHRLKREDFAPASATEPATVTLFGKRNKRRVIVVPPAVLFAIDELTRKLQRMAEHQGRHQADARAQRLLLEDAPLIPAISYWGANAEGRQEKDLTGLTRPGIAMLLRRRAIEAAIEPGTAEFARAHPHGLRSLFARMSAQAGTPGNIIQAIMGHASVATTGRYMEESEPSQLISRAFAAPPAVEEAQAEATQAAEAWQPAQPITPPASPRPKAPTYVEPPSPFAAPESPPSPPSPSPSRPLPRTEHEPTKRAGPRWPRSRSAQAELQSLDEMVERIERWRKKPLTVREDAKVERCLAVQDDTLARLCLIYQLHWGEEGNRQELLSTGGGRKRSVQTALEEGRFTPNPEDLDEDLDEDEDEDIDIEAMLAERGPEAHRRATERARELAATESRVRRMQPLFEQGASEAAIEELAAARELAGSHEAAVLASESDTEKLWRVYSGKDSGLSWWTGSKGRLRPAMPVMSPMQIGACSPEEKDAICGALVDLWHRWIAEEPTKAEALTRWLGEALDLGAQMQREVETRGGDWVAARAPWQATRFLGQRRKPEERKVFREHLAEEIVAWFEARGGQFRVSAGTPASWQKKVARPKAVGELAPDWYDDADPVYDLPFDERADLLAWIASLTGQPSEDTRLLFDVPDSIVRASRAEVTRFVDALCSFDQQIDVLQEYARQNRNSGLPFSVLGYDSVDQLPISIRRQFQTLQEAIRSMVAHVTLGRVEGFSAFETIKARVKRGQGIEEGEGGRRERFYLGLVKKFFGAKAASDPVVRLSAKCGRVPLGPYKDLFRIEGSTIRHTEAFKQAFADEFHTHSECVARRIARKLWEIRRHNPRSESVTRPQMMVSLVDIMLTFKVPCSRAQEGELRELGRFSDKPTGIFEAYKAAHTHALPELRSELEQLQGETQEQYAEALAREAQAAGSFYTENPGGRRSLLPTPVHLTCALALF